MLEHLTLETFKEKIMDFETDKENWKFKGELPAIVKFTAGWCNPCKVLTPILLDVSYEYNKRINIYEIDVDEESELASMFGIRSVPTMLFCPMTGEPTMTSGVLPKTTIVKTIESVFEI
jgi:thioredoxin